MPTNDFKAFAAAGGANVLSQADYLALAALSTGWSSGKASSAEVNKAVRQATFIAAALAQFVSNKSGLDTLDDGDVNGFVTKLLSALNKTSQPLDATLTALAALATGANKLPYFTGADAAAQTDLTQVGRDVIGQVSIADLLTYLGLGTAAKKDFGTGVGQLPDMSSFTYSSDGGRFNAHYFPSSNASGSFLLETALFTAAPGLSTCTPAIPPPTKILSVVASQRSNSAAGGTFSVELITGNQKAFVVYNSGSTSIDIQWQAWCI